LTGQRPANHHRDGEPGPKCDRYVVTVEPRALDVLVPRATLEDPHGPFVSSHEEREPHGADTAA